MNRTIATLILTVSATLGAYSLQAQNQATATVPFAFQAQAQTMPAGTYDIKQLSNNPALFKISDGQGHARFVAAPLQLVGNPEEPKLTFSCYKGACSLMKIDLPGSTVSRGLDPRKAPYHEGIASEIKIRATR